MSFARPELLWLIFALPLLAAAGVWGYVRRRRGVARAFGDPTLVGRLGAVDLERFATRRLILVGLGALALGIAAAGPRWGTEVLESEGRALNVVLALDVSKSMLARDVEPDRLEQERILANRLLRELRGDRFGIVVFAGRAYTLSPLTIDHSALALYLDALDPEVVSYGGSSLASAIRQAADLARGDTRVPGDEVVVLVSDGEALEEEGAVLDAAAHAAAAGVVVHTVGVGTAGGAPVPEPQSPGEQSSGYKRGPDGEIVISRLGRSLLERIAQRTGGRYLELAEAGATERLIATLREMERSPTEDGRRVAGRERFEWFVALALLLLAVDAVLARRPAGASWLPRLRIRRTMPPATGTSREELPYSNTSATGRSRRPGGGTYRQTPAGDGTHRHGGPPHKVPAGDGTDGRGGTHPEVPAGRSADRKEV